MYLDYVSISDQTERIHWFRCSGFAGPLHTALGKYYNSFRNTLLGISNNNKRSHLKSFHRCVWTSECVKQRPKPGFYIVDKDRMMF